jgi:hypothetical protein
MAGKRIISKPQGRMTTYKNQNGTVISRLDWNTGFKEKYSKNFDKKQSFVDSECIRKMNPETPRRTGVLVKSATLGTAIGTGEIHQIAPYARRQYYEHKSKSYWFERMKNRHKDTILKGAEKIE